MNDASLPSARLHLMQCEHGCLYLPIALLGFGLNHALELD